MRKQALFLFLVAFAFSCKKEQTNTDFTPDCSTAKSFSANVQPLMQASCATSPGCHDGGSNNGPGPLTTYSQVFNARASIRSAVASGQMPKNSSLTAAEKSTIICWIDSGAPNN